MLSNIIELRIVGLQPGIPTNDGSTEAIQPIFLGGSQVCEERVERSGGLLLTVKEEWQAFFTPI